MLNPSQAVVFYMGTGDPAHYEVRTGVLPINHQVKAGAVLDFTGYRLPAPPSADSNQCIETVNCSH
jgi:hypothetical protein